MIDSKTKYMVGLLWLLSSATPAMGHPPYVAPYKYTISLMAAAAVATGIGVVIGKKRLILGIVLGLLVFYVCAFVGLFVSILVSM